MSTEAYTWVRRLRKDRLGSVSDAARLTLYELAEYADPEGRNVWPSVGRLAEQREVSERTVKRHLRELEDARLIVRGDQEVVPARIPANRRPTVYDLAMKPVENSGSWGDTSDTPTTLWGDTDGRLGVTSGVTQTKNLTTTDQVTYSGTDRAGQPVDNSDPETTDDPDRECIHGWPIEFVGTGPRRVPKCPTCRRMGCVTPQPPPRDPSPERRAETEALLQSLRKPKETSDA